MKRALAATAIAGLCLIGTAPAFAASPSERECAAAGGTFERVNGEVTCTIVDPVGNSEHSGGHSQTVDSTESSNGTFNNKPKHHEECTGPGNGNSTAGC